MPQLKMKRCNDPNHEGDRYLPITKFHKQGFRYGKQAYAPKCKVCKNRQSREKYYNDKAKRDWNPEKKKAYSRARSRALSRLAKLHPETYGHVLMEELEKENENGFDFSSRGHIYRKLY